MNDPTLLADLKAAPVGDRELGDRVNEVFGWKSTSGPVGIGENGEMMFDDYWWRPDSREGAFTPGTQPNPTMSVDDGLALPTPPGYDNKGAFIIDALGGIWAAKTDDIALAISIALVEANTKTKI